MSSRPPEATDAKVEFYAGQRGDETPRAVVIDGRRLEVRQVLDRRRTLDAATGSIRETWRCRLEDGRSVTIERLGSGTRVRPAPATRARP